MDGGNEAGETQTGPSDIKERVLGDHVTLQRGISYKSCLLDLPGPYLLGLGTIGKNGGFRGDSLRTYGGDSPEKLIIRPGDLYISLKDVTQTGDLLGAVSRVPPYVPEGRLTQDTVKLIFKDDKISKDYVYWVLRTPQYRAYCKNRGTGTTNLDLSRNDFLIFPIPELTAERAGLVDIFEAVEGKIELNRRMNATLEAMARALFRSWFVDFDPVRAKAEGREPAGMDEETAALFPDALEESELGEIPKGWRVGKIGEEFNITMGQSPPGSSYNEDQDGIPFYQGKVDFGSRFPTERVYCTDPKRFADKNDTLLTVRAPVGELNLAIGPCCIGRGLAAVRHKSGSSGYTYYAFKELRDVFENFNGEGTVFGAITKDALFDLPWVTAPESVIISFERIVQSIDAQILVNERRSRSLSSLRDILLPEILSGRAQTNDKCGSVA